MVALVGNSGPSEGVESLGVVGLVAYEIVIPALVYVHDDLVIM